MNCGFYLVRTIITLLGVHDLDSLSFSNVFSPQPYCQRTVPKRKENMDHSAQKHDTTGLMTGCKGGRNHIPQG